MAIKYAQEIAQEIKKRGAIRIPSNVVTGDAFERWLYEESVDTVVYDGGYSDGIVRTSISSGNEFIVTFYAGEVA